MIVKLEKITKSNWEECLKLKVVENQKHFVAPNLYSIAEAQFYADVNPYAIYADNTMVGFAMYGFDDEDDEKEMWIWRLMIDKDHQGNGFGKAAMMLIIQDTKQKGFKKLYLSTEPHNVNGIKFYEKLGFVDTGEMNEDEEVFLLDLGQ